LIIQERMDLPEANPMILCIYRGLKLIPASMRICDRIGASGHLPVKQLEDEWFPAKKESHNCPAAGACPARRIGEGS
jgi:hypothetical protein